MLNILYRIGIFTLILIFLPLLLWIKQWEWYPENYFNCLKIFYWITQSASLKWGFLTSIILFIWIYLHCKKKSKIRLFLIYLLIIITLLIGQIIKFTIKKQMQSPRPFMFLISKNLSSKEEIFREMKHYINNETIIKEIEKKSVPLWLKSYWCKEKGSSFPSGHTIFSVSWTLIFMELLCKSKHKITILILIIWCNCVMISRIILGMHWIHEVLSSVIISWVIVSITIFYYGKFILLVEYYLKKR